jgi:hypothetical protein
VRVAYLEEWHFFPGAGFLGTGRLFFLLKRKQERRPDGLPPDETEVPECGAEDGAGEDQPAARPR